MFSFFFFFLSNAFEYCTKALVDKIRRDQFHFDYKMKRMCLGQCRQDIYIGL